MDFKIRFHGIGGQGVAASADLIAMAAVANGWYAHSFPSFGTEIRGGSVTAYARIAQGPIHVRSFIYDPNIVVIFSVDLLSETTCQGASPDSIILVNSHRETSVLPRLGAGKLVSIDADDIAASVGNPRIANAVLLGALLPYIPLIEMKNLEGALVERFSSAAAAVNIQGLHRGLAAVQSVEAAV